MVSSKKAVVTGGAGFIGTNLVVRLLELGWRVVVFDNLYRKGSEKNLKWLIKNFNSGRLKIAVKDVRDYEAVKAVVNKSEVVFHLAAQTAVTTSFKKPREDFEINALGSFNVLEAARNAGHKPMVIFASSNKVYGPLKDVQVRKKATRYVLKDKPYGISEKFPLDFHSPYGCSNGVADQYTQDYFRMYGVPTVVFRQSCIYGSHQLGVKDQGWVAHFVTSGLAGRPITIYGDGKQVRDLLYVDDLVEVYLEAVNRVKKVKGEVYNVGGGKENSVSLLELIKMLERIEGRKIKLKYAKWRPGDQRVFISDNRKAKRELGWEPKTGVEEGLRKLVDWVHGQR